MAAPMPQGRRAGIQVDRDTQVRPIHPSGQTVLGDGRMDLNCVPLSSDPHRMTTDQFQLEMRVDTGVSQG